MFPEIANGPIVVNWADFGISHRDQVLIESVFSSILGIQSVILFGSRAMKNFNPGSDIDLALQVTSEAESSKIIRKISVELNEKSKLPYRFDLVDLSITSHEDLLEHILSFGKLIWRV